MLTGELRNQVDSSWNGLGAGGIINLRAGMEQQWVKRIFA